MKSYYVIFETHDRGKDDRHWKIVETEHDLDTVSGLSAWIKERSREFGTGIFVLNWKELKRK